MSRRRKSTIREIDTVCKLKGIQYFAIHIRELHGSGSNKIRKKIDNLFWGEILAIIKAPINAPTPSDEAKNPISASFKFKIFFPYTGINEIRGNPKRLNTKVTINNNLRLISLKALKIMVFRLLKTEINS